MFRAEFSRFSISFYCWPAKKIPKLKKLPNQRKLLWSELVKAKKNEEDPDFEGSEHREDQSCAKKLFFMDTNHICTKFLKKPIPNAF
jgi:hypothetical protein